MISDREKYLGAKEAIQRDREKALAAKKNVSVASVQDLMLGLKLEFLDVLDIIVDQYDTSDPGSIESRLRSLLTRVDAISSFLETSWKDSFAELEKRVEKLEKERK